MSETFDVTQIQGNILRGYKRAHARHLFLKIVNPGAARQWLAASAAEPGASTDVPVITRESPRKWKTDHPTDKKPDLCFNVGFTYNGLLALGMPAGVARNFSAEFVEGMKARATKLGDVDASSPSEWLASFQKSEDIHVMASLHAETIKDIDEAEGRILNSGGPFARLETLNGHTLPGGKVYFGYTDSLSQPKFKEVADPNQIHDKQPYDPLGTVLLGHPTTFGGLTWRDLKEGDFQYNGTFNAFRMMKQHVDEFESYLDAAAKMLLAHPDREALLQPGDEARFKDLLDDVYGKDAREATAMNAMREIVAAHLCGRWRNGHSLHLAPDTPDQHGATLGTGHKPSNAFHYPRDTRCPAGSHVRRCHPRDGQIVQRVTNYSRRIIRRGMVYEHNRRSGHRYGPEDGRGLLGNFIGASLGAQFEAMMCDWLNLGLHDPDITGSNDPLVGANSPVGSWFELPLKNGGSIRLTGFPRFVTTRAGGYFFLPSLKAIAQISTWSA